MTALQAPRRMDRRASSAQKGAVLVVATILLMVITAFVLSSFSYSVSDIRAVGNVQAQDEVLSAARQALELKVGSDFGVTQAAQTVTVDVNQDGTDDVQVAIDAPVCTRVVDAGGATDDDDLSSTSLPVSSNAAYTLWHLRAVATDTRTGARAEVQEGVMIKLSKTVKDSVCPG